MTKFRMHKADSLNWNVEKWESGGEIATRGRNAGQPKKARWSVIGHYSSLKNAALGIMDDLIADELGNNFASGKQILAAIETAEKKIMASLQAQKDKTEILL